MINRNLLTDCQVVQAHDPVDGNTAAIVGARVSMKNSLRLNILAILGASAGSTVQFSLKQHNAAVGGTSKPLAIDSPYYKKVGAATQFTKVEPVAAAADYDLSADLAAAKGIVMFDIVPEQLDVNNGFAWVSIEIADTATAKMVSTMYLLGHKEQPGFDKAV